MRQTILRMLHVLSLGLWFGGSAFFSFAAAPAIFASFEKVVHDGPSDRTAGLTIIDPNASPEQKKALGSSLAGAAVGPIFPKFFAMQTGCSVVALFTALAWWHWESARRLHLMRVVLLALGVVLVLIGWPISNEVSQLRLERFSADSTIAEAARQAFGPWHLVSLGLSAFTTLLAGIALGMAGKMPNQDG